MRRSSENHRCADRLLRISLLAAAGAITLLGSVATLHAEPVVAALVDGDPIFAGEVEAMYVTITDNRTMTGAAGVRGRADALRQLIMRRLAERALLRDESYITQTEVDKELNNMKAAALAKKLTIEQFAEQRGVSMSALRHDIIWNIGWNRYLDRNRNASLQAYFDEHHKDYDGTQVRASHILLRPSRGGETTQQLIEQAKKIREEIESGKLTFPQAATKYSAGPSRRQGGDLGIFPRNNVMMEEFAKAAFGLEKGEISEPVVTPFGVHLIQATEIHPGTLQWTEVLEKITGPTTRVLFEKVANEEGKGAKIEFTGKVPYFKPGTDELVTPKDAAKP